MLSSLNLEPGNIVGGYTLISRLGGGAMGSVWRVRDDGGNVYAMKILRDSLAEDEDTIEPLDDAIGASVHGGDADSPQHEANAATARERLRREATALRKIDHPGVCRIEDMELDDSLAFIVTELIEGNNLRQDVAMNGRYVAQDLERLAAKLMDAVAAVHNAGIIHRDIKPTNVMVATTGPMLVDFGIAMGEGESHVTRTGLVMGTPGFIAPEIIDGAESDEITDWWSTAAVLAFAATGKPVFGSKPMMAVLERAASGHADLSGLPQGTAEAFRKALDPDRTKRCSPQELLQAITTDAMQPEVWDQASSATAVPVAGKSAVLQQGPQSAPPAPPTASSTLPPTPPTPPTAPSTQSSEGNQSSNDTQGSDEGKVVRPFGASSSGDSASSTNPRLAWQNTPLPNLALIEQSIEHAMPTQAMQTAVLGASGATTVMPQEATTVMPSGFSDQSDQAETQIIGGTTPISAQTRVMPARMQAELPATEPTQYMQPQLASPAQYVQPSGQAEQTQIMQPAPPQPQYAQQLQYPQPLGNDDAYAEFDNANEPEDYQESPPEGSPDELSQSVNPQRGRITLLAILLPLAFLAACAPTWAVIIGSISMWVLTTLGIARLAFVSRIDKRGKRGGSDMIVALGSLPWHAFKGLIATLPSVLVLIACSVVLDVILAAVLHLPTARTQQIMFGLPVSMPLIVGAPASLSGIALMIGYACGWAASTLTSNSHTLLVGASTLRETCLTSQRPRLRWTLLIVWIIVTLAGLATTVASSSLDWYPFAVFFN